MPQTVIVNGEEILVGENTTIAVLRKAAKISDETIAFYQTDDDVVRLLQDDEIIAERVPEGATIEFHPGQIGLRSEDRTDDTNT
jgi:sulfur carrier protein ThiS